MKFMMKWWNLWLEITISIEIISTVNVPVNKYKELQLNFKLKLEKGFSKPDNFSSSKKSSRHLIKSWKTRNCTSWMKKNCKT